MKERELSMQKSDIQIRKTIKSSLTVLVVSLTLAGIAQATPVTLTGNYVKTAVSDRGTLGSNGNTSPGLLYDKTGTQNFGVNDYLTPGNPWDMFSVNSTQSGLRVNNNDSSYMGIPTTSGPTSLSSGSINSASWSGTAAGLFSLTNTYSFGANNQAINVRTVVTALTDLTNLMFARAIDPDPDVNTYGSYSTINGRGDTSRGLAAADWVHSVGAQTGLPLGLYTNSSIAHNSAVTNWSSNPADYLAGGNIGNGDYTIGLGFNIGNLAQGKSVTLDYSYVMGGSLDTAPVPSAVPLPGAVWLFGSAMLGFIGFNRTKKSG